MCFSASRHCPAPVRRLSTSSNLGRPADCFGQQNVAERMLSQPLPLVAASSSCLLETITMEEVHKPQDQHSVQATWRALEDEQSQYARM